MPDRAQLHPAACNACGQMKESMDVDLSSILTLVDTRIFGRHEDAFNQVLHIGEMDLLDWLCSQVDPSELCSREPVPLSQGVLLSLVSQLSTNLTKVTDLLLLTEPRSGLQSRILS